ncbi:MAG: GDP-mannose 4,6-dehydratase [Thermoleophilia bacterium]
MKVFITGINGFAGSHLTRYLLDIGGISVTGLDLSAPPEALTSEFGRQVPVVHCCDLGDTAAVAAALEQEQPDAVIHLAARAQVAGAWENASAIMEANVVGTQALMQSLHAKAPKARVLMISSSEVYGKAAPDEMPMTETSHLRPGNPYSVSKIAQEFVGLQYREAFGMEVVVARPFNHIGPRQVGNFVVAAFARQIAEIEAGQRQPVLRVGNLESSRDFTDVRDIVAGYYLLLTQGVPGECYNVASGKSHPISEILDILLSLARVQPEIEPIPELMRPSDTPIVIGDASKLRELGDWQPRIPLEQSLTDTLNYWREQVSLSTEKSC